MSPFIRCLLVVMGSFLEEQEESRFEIAWWEGEAEEECDDSSVVPLLQLKDKGVEGMDFVVQMTGDVHCCWWCWTECAEDGAAVWVKPFCVRLSGGDRHEGKDDVWPAPVIELPPPAVRGEAEVFTLTPSCLLCCCRDISHSMLALSVFIGRSEDPPTLLAVTGAPTSECVLVLLRVSASSDGEEAS